MRSKLTRSYHGIPTLKGHLGGGSFEEDDDATVDPSNSEGARGTVRGSEIFESFVLPKSIESALSAYSVTSAGAKVLTR